MRPTETIQHLVILCQYIEPNLELLCTELNMRVPYRFFGIQDRAYLKAGIRESRVRRERDAGLLLGLGHWNRQIEGAIREIITWMRIYKDIDLRESPNKRMPRIASHAAVFRGSRFSSPHKRESETQSTWSARVGD